MALLEKCHHCWHVHDGPMWIIIPDGHIIQACCVCKIKRIIHQDHATWLKAG